MRCKYCDKQINSYGHYGQCKKYKEVLDIKLSKDTLYDLYIVKQYSALEISQITELANAGTIIARLKKFNIPTRNSKKSHAIDRSQQKRYRTNIEKYGAYNTFCRDSSSRKMWETRLLEEEGITNVFQRDSVKIKIANTLLERYGTEKPSEITTARGKNVYSSIHKTVVEMLNSLGLLFDIEFKLPSKGKWYYSYDILLKPNKIIEVHGDYWHGNPIIYKPTDIILKGSSKEILVAEKWKSDKDKINHALRFGYNVLVLWEYDIKNYPNQVIDNIKEFYETN